MTTTSVLHPAPFSEAILALIEEKRLLPERGTVLDPFAGVGRLYRLATPTRRIIGVELEPEWAAAHPGTIVGNALALPFADDTVDVVCTSPCYGNRYADHHNAGDPSLRRSYTHDLRRMTGDSGRQLHPDNLGRFYAWRPEYWAGHQRAWSEVRHVLPPGGRFVLNVSDCIHSGRTIPVVDEHIALCRRLGFRLVERHDVKTPRMRQGANGTQRVATEAVLAFTLEAP